MKKDWVVRVTGVKEDEHFNNPLLECLRYAGIVVVHNEDCFDLLPPATKGLDTKKWAEMNAERMRSFFYNAVAAPRWTAIWDAPKTGTD